MGTLTVQPRSGRISIAAKFALVGLSGILVNQLALAIFTELGGVFFLISAVAATQFSSSWNFLGTEFWVFSGRPVRGRRLGRYAAFLALNNGSLLLRIPLLWFLADIGHINYLIANPMTLAAVWAARFLFADGFIWAATSAVLDGAAPGHAAGSGAGRPHLVAVGPGFEGSHRYDVAGILHIESAVELPELRYFMAEPGSEDMAEPDIRIEITRVGLMPNRSTRFVAAGSTLSYYEHLGLAGANFRITMGSPIVVQVSPLLARSRHVLYTNVIEALLRFLLVSRGYVLLHSACIKVDGGAVLLSAQTDTGKTSTVIQLVRERGYEFLSDDMTIIAPDGRAICYPKPMTLSYHTMSSIRGDDLRRRQRMALAVQSRLHSKSGRTVGRFLGRRNLPIMSVNSVVQILVPPPKYHIDSLIDCEIGRDAPITHAFVMERGEPLSRRMSLDEAVGQLIENTDDAYGFPPFSTFAPHVRIGGDDYPSLRAKEESLLRRALTRVVTMQVRVPGHEWAELLPDLIEGPSPHPAWDSPGMSLVPIPVRPEVEEPVFRAKDGA
jgi:dolichol-phosphate mannosyltransferase